MYSTITGPSKVCTIQIYNVNIHPRHLLHGLKVFSPAEPAWSQSLKLDVGVVDGGLQRYVLV
jgi:hypothetical protein